MCKTIIAGSRTITDYSIVKEAIRQSNFNITEVICGLAKGPDLLGEKYALENHIPITYFPANWEELGKYAGVKRNEDMGNYAEQLIAIYDGKSRGTKHMIHYAKQKGLRTFVFDINTNSLLNFL